MVGVSGPTDALTLPILCSMEELSGSVMVALSAFIPMVYWECVKGGGILGHGADYKQMYTWKEGGTEPSGGVIHSLHLFASRIPNGLEILLGEEFQMTFLKDSQECPVCRRRNRGEEGPSSHPVGRAG